MSPEWKAAASYAGQRGLRFVLTGLVLIFAFAFSSVGQADSIGRAGLPPLPAVYPIAFAPLTSTPFYDALRDSQKAYGCTTPQAWRVRHPGEYPETMIVQLVDRSGRPEWHLVMKRWSFRHIGGYVQLLCPQIKRAKVT